MISPRHAASCANWNISASKSTRSTRSTRPSKKVLQLPPPSMGPLPPPTKNLVLHHFYSTNGALYSPRNSRHLSNVLTVNRRSTTQPHSQSFRSVPTVWASFALNRNGRTDAMPCSKRQRHSSCVAWGSQPTGKRLRCGNKPHPLTHISPVILAITLTRLASTCSSWNTRTTANLPICKRFVKPHVAAGHENSDGYSTTLSPPMVPDPRKPYGYSTTLSPPMVPDPRKPSNVTAGTKMADEAIISRLHQKSIRLTFNNQAGR